MGIKKWGFAIACAVFIVSCSYDNDSVLITNNSSVTVSYHIWDDSAEYTLTPGESLTHSIYPNHPHEPQGYKVVGDHNSIKLTYVRKSMYTFDAVAPIPLEIASTFHSGITITIKELNDRMDADSVIIQGGAVNTSQNVFTTTPRFVVTGDGYTPIIDTAYSDGKVYVTIH